MNTTLKSLAAMAALTACALGAAPQAGATPTPPGTVTLVQGYTFNLGSTLSNVALDQWGAPANTGIVPVLSLPRFDYFDPGLGTLLAVQWKLVDLNVKMDLKHTVEIVTYPSITRYDLAAHSAASVRVGGGGLLGMGNQSFQLAVEDGAGCGASNPIGIFGIVGCTARTIGSDSLQNKIFDVDRAKFADFQRTGTFTQLIDGRLDWNDRIDAAWMIPSLPPRLNGNSEINGTFGIDGKLELMYVYAPVPEPAAWMLLAGALPLVALRRRGAARQG